MIHTTHKLCGATAAAVVMAVAPPGAFADPSTINLSAHSVFAAETQGGTRAAKPLATIPQGHAVTVGCRVVVKGQAGPIDPNVVGSGYGSAGWQLTGKQAKGYDALAFAPALKVALFVNDQPATVATIQQLPLNAAFPVPSPPSYPFDNAGMLHVVSVDWVFSTAGTQTLRCLVDAAHTVKEVQESDNERKTTVTVTGPLTQHGASSASAAGTPPVPKQTFRNPSWQDRRVDWCLDADGRCGGRAATEFCTRMGYGTATAWIRARKIGSAGATVRLGDGTPCTARPCDGFASITCAP